MTTRALIVFTVCAMCGLSRKAQAVDPLQPSFTYSGVHPDGYIDLSKLPAAPQGIVNSPAVTTTLPVSGVAGLNVTVTIPALTPSIQIPTYITTDGIFGLAGRSSGQPTLTLKFSKPVYGVAADVYAKGRQTFQFAMYANTDRIPSGSGLSAPGSVVIRSETSDVLGETAAKSLQIKASNSYSEISSIEIVMPEAAEGTAVVANLRVQSAFDMSSANIPRSGLELWYEGMPRIGNPYLVTPVSYADVPDRSGNGRNGTVDPANPSYLNFSLPINGWNEMTIFLVAKSYVDQPGGAYGSETAGVFFNENASWGNTYVSPFQTHETFRFGTTQVGNMPNYVRPTNVGQDYTISRAVHNNTVDSLYIDGVLALQQGGKHVTLAGMDGTGFVGRGYQNTGYEGLVGDVLIYNRVLTAAECGIIESYLRTKYQTR